MKYVFPIVGIVIGCALMVTGTVLGACLHKDWALMLAPGVAFAAVSLIAATVIATSANR